ncbi:MAG: CPBP family intramembrane metalloprotease, partial [Planctomycetes bacterium]|nr:CPBP family intramembrane metalloprotease [Planctomycetota bacterium]
EMFVFVLFAMVVAASRYGRRAWRLLGLAPLSVRQAALIAVLSLPLSFACGRLHHWCLAAWKALGQHVPILWQLEQFETMDAIRSFSETTPWPALLLLLAAAPAFGEELMFRGVIGTGLVARRGIVGGILLTSLLFAGVHMHPAHAVALIPLAVFLHLVYLATHSLWAPIWLHFLNNAIAVSVLKTSEVGAGGELTADMDWPLAVTVLAIVSSLALGRWIWQTRIQFVLPDGTLWNPGYVSAERPPRDLQTVVQPGRPAMSTALVAVVTVAAFLVLASVSLVA